MVFMSSAEICIIFSADNWKIMWFFDKLFKLFSHNLPLYFFNMKICSIFLAYSYIRFCDFVHPHNALYYSRWFRKRCTDYRNFEVFAAIFDASSIFSIFCYKIGLGFGVYHFIYPKFLSSTLFLEV